MPELDKDLVEMTKGGVAAVNRQKKLEREKESEEMMERVSAA